MVAGAIECGQLYLLCDRCSHLSLPLPTPTAHDPLSRTTHTIARSHTYCKHLTPWLLHQQAGDTFMIPTGWIHAVYTPEQSLVFGGNFLHSFDIEGQLSIAGLEARLRVPIAYRFPLYEELHWFAAEDWCTRLLGHPRKVSAHPAGTLCRGDGATRPLGKQTGAGREAKAEGEAKVEGEGERAAPLSKFEASGLERLVAQLQVWLVVPLVSSAATTLRTRLPVNVSPHSIPRGAGQGPRLYPPGHSRSLTPTPYSLVLTSAPSG